MQVAPAHIVIKRQIASFGNDQHCDRKIITCFVRSVVAEARNKVQRRLRELAAA